MSADDPLVVENEVDIKWAFDNLLGPSHRLALTCAYCGEVRNQLWSRKGGLTWFHNHPCTTTFPGYTAS